MDADAYPKVIKEFLFCAAKRVQIFLAAQVIAWGVQALNLRGNWVDTGGTPTLSQSNRQSYRKRAN